MGQQEQEAAEGERPRSQKGESGSFGWMLDTFNFTSLIQTDPTFASFAWFLWKVSRFWDAPVLESTQSIIEITNIHNIKWNLQDIWIYIYQGFVFSRMLVIFMSLIDITSSVF